jgi:hypothetical protein
VESYDLKTKGGEYDAHHFLPVAAVDNPAIVFLVRAAKDATIALFDRRRDQNIHYEILLGTNGHKYHVFFTFHEP